MPNSKDNNCEKAKAKTKKHKPEVNQPPIKSFTRKDQSGKKDSISARRVSITETSATRLLKAPEATGKKRSPPTPPEHPPTKKLIISSEDKNGTMDQEEIQLSDELQNLRKLLNADLDEKLRPIQDSIKSLEKTSEDVATNSNHISSIKEENKKLQEDCNKIRKENQKLKNRLAQLEDKMLENHIIIQGIQDQAWELPAITREKTLTAISDIANGDTPEKRLEITRKISINTIRRIGTYNEHRNRPVCIEFTTKSSADFLYENKKKLKKGIYADRAYSDEVARERRKLIPILRRARQMSEYKGKCMLNGRQLVLKGKKYTTENISNLPDNLSGFHVSSKSDDNTIGFFGELSPFSNFHSCEFELDETKYHCSEQFIQHQKAIHFEDDITAKRIMNCETAQECKQLSREIENYDPRSWSEVAEEKCLPGVTAKFEQNPNLQYLLISTGNKKIVECSYDKTWGTGTPLHDENCLKPDQWSGKNLLGQMLMKIRSELLNNKEDDNPPMETTNPGEHMEQ